MEDLPINIEVDTDQRKHFTGKLKDNQMKK